MTLSLTDVVIDTNVFVHAGNPDVEHFDGAIKFLKEVLDSETVICVDKNKNEYPGKILYEYRDKIRGQHFGSHVFSKLLQQKRFVDVKRKIPQKEKKILLRLINKLGSQTDKIFVIVAYNSGEKILVSHDFDDFSRDIRGKLKKDLGVEVPCSGQVFREKTGNCAYCSIWRS